MTCWSRSGIPGRAYARKTSTVFSIHFTRPSRPGWAWDWLSAGQLSKDTGDEYGRQRTSRGAPHFISRSPSLLNGSRRKSRARAKWRRRNRRSNLHLRHIGRDCRKHTLQRNQDRFWQKATSTASFDHVVGNRAWLGRHLD